MEDAHYKQEICKFSKFLLFFLVLLIVPAVSASNQITIYLDGQGNALFVGSADSTVTLPDGVNIRDGIISGETSSLTSKQGSLWRFSYSLDNAELNIILPKDAIVKNLSSGEIFIHRGQISIYTRNSIELSYEIQPLDETNWLTIAIIILAVLIIIAILYAVLKSRKKNIHKNEHSVKNLEGLLHERENLILKNLRKTGTVKASYLRKISGLPKASFSRHIQELEKKGLVKRSGEGKNKFVSLK